MALAIPMLSAFDPPAGSEGTLDPLGLYQIADQLATKLVPAVRERMQRIRFLTAMAVGAVLTEELEGDPEQPECPPFMVWEWLVVESLIRTFGTSDENHVLRGVPGTLVTRRAVKNPGYPGYLDSRCYLKTPRIFGFHGVYKRLANHLRLVDVHMSLRSEAERLADAWAKDLGYGGLRSVQSLLERWRDAVRRSLACRPCRTRTGWSKQEWEELATAFRPDGAGRREKRFLRESLHAANERGLGMLSEIWKLQTEFSDDDYTEETLQERLRVTAPQATAMLDAIKAYEQFCRGLQDAFDVLRNVAGRPNVMSLDVPSIATDEGFSQSVNGLDRRYSIARERLAEIDAGIAGLFDERFRRFAEPMSPSTTALELCEHHETIQKGKSATGKRPWFDRLGGTRIYLRQQYRIPEQEIRPNRFVHAYRGRPIRNFYFDL